MSQNVARLVKFRETILLTHVIEKEESFISLPEI